ncbi:hypothetical protein HPP92_015200 [Vanilla planifolia]|uniref:HECT-type E3 ubiquitin transferase n=1 Tax=Vanilla planifolia TaxID=51239 RepID=A0A835QRL7_VANPL|nr:hypothetical protein HPP92_015200 [Vanilla planifolia]
MSDGRKISQVSLRGAIAREISRNAPLEKVVHERQLRNFTRRASAAAIFIQRVWRCFYVMKKVGKQLQEQWTALADSYDNQETVDWISSNLIRPFLFFTSSFTSHLNLNLASEGCLSVCFRILLQSINTADSGKNFCSQAVGTVEERSRWFSKQKS